MLVNGLPQHYSGVPESSLHMLPQPYTSKITILTISFIGCLVICLTTIVSQLLWVNASNCWSSVTIHFNFKPLHMTKHKIIVPPVQVRVVLVNSRQNQLSN